MSKIHELEQKIETKLSEYVGFDIKEIINEDMDAVHVFGGAVRDIIADKEIHDVDILCMFESMRKMTPILERNGYFVHKSLTAADIQSMYSEIHVVIEPITYMKIIDNEIRLIQLIRPGHTKLQRGVQNYNDKNTGKSLTNFFYLLGQVDMSNCAVHYSHSFGLKESFHGAVEHCIKGIFEVLDTEMKTNRFEGRKQKMLDRGWSSINNQSEATKKKLLRINKLNNIIGDEDTIYSCFMPPPGPQVEIRSNDEYDIDDLF